MGEVLQCGHESTTPEIMCMHSARQSPLDKVNIHTSVGSLQAPGLGSPASHGWCLTVREPRPTRRCSTQCWAALCPWRSSRGSHQGRQCRSKAGSGGRCSRRPRTGCRRAGPRRNSWQLCQCRRGLRVGGQVLVGVGVLCPQWALVHHTQGITGAQGMRGRPQQEEALTRGVHHSAKAGEKHWVAAC